MKMIGDQERYVLMPFEDFDFFLKAYLRMKSRWSLVAHFSFKFKELTQPKQKNFLRDSFQNFQTVSQLRKEMESSNGKQIFQLSRQSLWSAQQVTLSLTELLLLFLVILGIHGAQTFSNRYNRPCESALTEDLKGGAICVKDPVSITTTKIIFYNIILFYK